MHDFQFCQDLQRRRNTDASFQKFKLEKTMDGASSWQWESDACFNPLTLFPNTLAHLAQLVKAFTVPRCSHMSPVRTMPGPFGFFSFTKLIFSYFYFI